MSNTLWMIISFVIGWLIVSASNMLGIPFFVIFIVIMPLAVIGLVYFSASKTFSPNLKIEDIPPERFSPRTRELDEDANMLLNLGFEKIDGYYIQLIPDTVAYVFKHREDPFYIIVYHLGAKKSCDVITFFENGITLSTANEPSAGSLPRKPEALLQVFANASYMELAMRHKRSVEYLIGQGMKPVLYDVQQMRQKAKKSIVETGELVKKQPFWPVMLIVWTQSGRGKNFLMPVEEQIRLGTARIISGQTI